MFGLMVGHPDEPTWMASIHALEAAIAEAKSKLIFGKRQDRRGSFQMIAVGVSYGGGQKVCSVRLLLFNVNMYRAAARQPQA